MLLRFRVPRAIVIGLAAAGLSSVVRAAPGDAAADAVLGQADFASGTANAGGGATASSLNEPRGLAIDRVSGRLFVTDSMNHRVLSWPSAAAFTNGQAADIVLGQPDFTSNTANQGGLTPTAKTLNAPKSVAVDSGGGLYVADSLNVRILRYQPPFTTNMAASRVFGQAGDFTTANQASIVSPNADTFGNPDGLAIDAGDRLYVVDRFLSRVTIFSTPLASTSADLVIGQPNLTTAGGNLTPAGLDHCSGAALDAAGNLYVGDEFNNRALLFLAPLTSGQAAARVFGQPDFASNTANNGGISASSINYSGASATVAIDPVSGNLYVSDALNNRVLEYTSPQTDSIADRVFGQPDFATGTANTGGRSASTLQDPAGVAFDAAGNLYVSDRLNHRVLRYNVARSDVGVVASAAPDPVSAGSSLTFTITVTNAGPDPATNVTLTDELSAAVSLVSATASQGACGGSGPFTCSLGTIASGASATIALLVTPTQVGTASLTASVVATEADSNTTNNATTATATVVAATTGGGDGNDGGSGDGNDDGSGDGGTPDTDGDGVLDDADNCPMMTNADQADENEDGIGDICELPGLCGACGTGILSLGLIPAPLLLLRRLLPRRGH